METQDIENNTFKEPLLIERPIQRPTFQQTISNYISNAFFTHIPDLDYQKNEKYRWSNIYTYVVQKSLMKFILSLTIGSMFDAYIYILLGNSNAWIGYISGATGLATLICAVPIGIFVDKWNRAFVSKIACMMLLIASAIGFFSILFDFIVGLFAFMIFTKIAIEISFSAGSTLFVDSLSIKERSRYMMLTDSISSFAQAFGPFITVIFFLVFGDDWELYALRILLCTSSLTTLPAMAFTCYHLKNVNPHLIDFAPPLAMESHPSDEHTTLETNYVSNIPEYQGGSEKSIELITPTHRSSSSTDVSENDIQPTHTMTYEEHRFSRMTFKNRSTPYFNMCCNITRSFGTGMLIKYQPLFFKEEYNFSPVHVALLLVSQSVIIAIAIQFAGLFTKPLGRPLTSLIFGIIGTIALVWITFARPLYLSIILFLVRTGFQNAITPIDQALISDYIISKHRGKWNSAFSFTQFLWSGSALLGGIISDGSGYRSNFIITSLFYAFSNVVYTPVLFFVLEEDRPKFWRSRRSQIE